MNVSLMYRLWTGNIMLIGLLLLMGCSGAVTPDSASLGPAPSAASATTSAMHQADMAASTPPAAENPYVQPLNSSVRGRSAQEVQSLRNGEGAGYARMAEYRFIHLRTSPDDVIIAIGPNCSLQLLA